MCARNITVFVVSQQHLVGVSALLQLVLSNNEIEPLSMAKEVADCLDTFTNGRGSLSVIEREKDSEKKKDREERESARLLYKAAAFDFKRPPDDEPYHDVCILLLLFLSIKISF